MTVITTYLSPGGQQRTRAEGPATHILVATLDGVVTLTRETPGSDWRDAGRSLPGRHVGQLLHEPSSGKLFAGAHVDGGLWVSDDDDDGGGAELNPKAWYETGAARSCVMRGTDRGHHWRELSHGMPDPMAGACEAMAQHVWPGGMMLAVGTATGEVYTSEDARTEWRRVARGLPPVSKDNHHLPFMSEEVGGEAMAVRGFQALDP